MKHNKLPSIPSPAEQHKAFLPGHHKGPPLEKITSMRMQKDRVEHRHLPHFKTGIQHIGKAVSH